MPDLTMDAIKPATKTLVDPAPERSWPKPVTEISREVQDKYAGQWVAWGFDGETILYHSKDPRTMRKGMIEAGLDPSRCVFDYIDELDTQL